MTRGRLFTISVGLLWLWAGASVFWWAVIPKIAPTKNEPPVVLRWQYLDIARELVHQYPVTGVGIVNFTRIAVDSGLYQQHGIHDSQNWQPTHNIYMLVLAELGVIGFLLYVFSLGWVGIALLKSWWRHSQLSNIVALIIFSSLVFLGLFDHFLWTLPAGMLLWWMAIFVAVFFTSLYTRDGKHP